MLSNFANREVINRLRPVQNKMADIKNVQNSYKMISHFKNNLIICVVFIFKLILFDLYLIL